jgi:hypothetical protein
MSESLYTPTGLSPILHYAKKNGYTKLSLCRLLGISRPTLERFIKYPYTLRLHELMLLGGLFGLPVEELVYIILRNKPQIKKRGVTAKGVSYLEEIRNKHKEDK